MTKLIDEGTLLRTAKIIGPQSAAQQALDEAMRQRAAGREVVFVKHGATILVVDAETRPEQTPASKTGA